MASFICRRCRSHAQKLSLQYRLFTSSAPQRANDPASALADLFQESETEQPTTDPAPSSHPNEARDSSNPYLHQSTADMSRPANDPASTSTPVPTKARALQDFLRDGTRTEANKARQLAAKEQQAIDRAAMARRAAIESQMSRIWREGDVYAPRDLTAEEQLKAKFARAPARARDMRPVNTRKQGGRDVLDDLAIDPVKEYKNFKMMSEFVTEMGRIRHSRDTGFRAVNQRKMARAVRRAHGLGLLPTSHRHPELQRQREEERRNY